ncbi:MAG: CPBP family intramembrane metalloprotease [Blautia sp.]|nr:CPBP family intramembrane metalloprotease [Lachnoclostridium sp.]MCM1212658.1 CPBP family intramembrane metalloprotease [Blautia sp.]
MTDKRLEAKRLMIFILLAFAISWIPAVIFNKAFGYHDWFETNKMPVFFWIVGYGPALANVLTRKLTHEGFHDSMLHLNLKGNIKYYLFSVFGLSVLSIPRGIFITLVIGHGDWSDLGMNMGFSESAALLLLVFATVPLMAFNTFGEEFGWRGYMNQKMEPLLGTVGTAIIGGAIWGLWHAVLTVEGHNFGTDYVGYPYLGILCMCISCIATGIFLMWLTKKTNSVYPAAIFHAMNNFGGMITGDIFISGVPEGYMPTIWQWFIVDIPFDIAAAVFLWLMLREKKGRKAE